MIHYSNVVTKLDEYRIKEKAVDFDLIILISQVFAFMTEELRILKERCNEKNISIADLNDKVRELTNLSSAYKDGLDKMLVKDEGR